MQAMTLSNNLYHCGVYCLGAFFIDSTIYNSISSFRFNFPKHALNGVEGDPLFVNKTGSNFSISQGSPAIDAGIDLKGLVDYDITVNSRPKVGGWDIGAYEK